MIFLSVLDILIGIVDLRGVDSRLDQTSRLVIYRHPCAGIYVFDRG